MPILPLTPVPTPSSSRTSRPSRADGSQTRRQILEVAGRLFADKGLSRTTSKEICALAGSNMAAVNYHFGGKDGLYQQVLVESHKQLVSIEELQHISGSTARANDKLARLLEHVLVRPPGHRHWGLRVLIHEMLAPSEHVPVLVRQAVLPKVSIMLGWVAEIVELPVEHPAVQRAMAFVLLPCMVLLVAPKPVRKQVLPALDADAQATLRDMLVYVEAGLQAIRGKYRVVETAVEPASKAKRHRAP